MSVSLDPERQAMIDAACKMYGTASQLKMHDMILDANGLAAKARNLIDKALEGVIDPQPPKS